MTTLSELRAALIRAGPEWSQREELSDSTYQAALDIMSCGHTAYKDFIVPQLSRLFASLLRSRLNISVLEIAPGPMSVLGHLPDHLRRTIRRYTAFEPNIIHASKLADWIQFDHTTQSPFPGLGSPPEIARTSFTPEANESGGSTDNGFDVILICHSIYAKSEQRACIETATEMLVKRLEGGRVIIFHSDGILDFDSLVSNRNTLFPTGTVSVPNDDNILDIFASYLAGFELRETAVNEAVRSERHRICRTGGRENDGTDQLLFSAPMQMVVFNQHAVKLPALLAGVSCPLPECPTNPKLIFIITGDICAGKDFCADVWAVVLREYGVNVGVVSISDTTKKEYAAATGADEQRLFEDRAYKEQHRPALTAFYRNQLTQRSQLPEEHFLHVVNNAARVNALLITGMRDDAPVATFSPLVPLSKVLEVRINAPIKIRENRGKPEAVADQKIDEVSPSSPIVTHRPDLVFNNERDGKNEARLWAQTNLFPFCSKELERLKDMVRSVPNFPTSNVEFRHILDIVQRQGGLSLCTSLLRTHYLDDWSRIGAIVGCEAGGWVFASALAQVVDRPLALIREAGKLPPPTVMSLKDESHISAFGSGVSGVNAIEMASDVISKGDLVVIVDDVLASGRTLCAVLRLLGKNSIRVVDITVIVVAEFPVHRGRDYLRQQGFGAVRIQSLLVFDGA